jgi:hypothetical protein
MKHVINSFLLGFAFIGLFSGCSTIYVSKSSSCIPTNVTAGYDLNLHRQDETTTPHRKPMPAWWKSQLNWTQVDNLDLYLSIDLVMQPGNKMWIAGYPDASGNSIVRYNTATGEAKKYAIFDQNGKGFVADDLLEESDGTLWARLVMVGTEPNYSVLATYDSEQDGFSIVTDQGELLKPVPTGGTHYIDTGHVGLAEAPDGVLVIVLDGKIYTYDPVMNQAKLILGSYNGSFVNTIAVSRNGHIWFIAQNDPSIRELDPIKGTIWNYGSPPGITMNDPADQITSMPKAIQIDNDGRVWVSDFGWLEPTNQETRYKWHAISRSSVFISIYDPEYMYLWTRPYTVYQFSDGNIWYVSGIGIVRFNFHTGEWCWKATEFGPLGEDADGNIWLVTTKGQIYEYKIDP